MSLRDEILRKYPAYQDNGEVEFELVKEQRSRLRSFWKSWNLSHTKQEKLSLLVQYSSEYQKDYVDRETKRQQFIDSSLALGSKKYQTRCRVCRRKILLIRHHIILLKNGGRNLSSNIILICRICHAEIHPWLKGKVG